MWRRPVQKLTTRVHDWMESLGIRSASSSLPAGITRRARLALLNLEDRTTPATFTVLNTGGGTGAGTLNEAITQLNLSTDPTNTINFSLPSPSTITLTEMLPAIAKPVVIQGPSTAANLTINGGGFQIFDTQPAAVGDAITFDKLTLTNGIGTGQSLGATGGAITVGAQIVTVSNSLIQGNTAKNGGGIHVHGLGTLIVNDSTISGNSATTDTNFYGGGGIYFRTGGNLTVNRSTISGNSSTKYGGGILFYSDMGTVVIDRSTLSGNVASAGDGGALYSYSASGNFTLTNSTIAANTAVYNGGGFRFSGLTGTVNIQNSTITGNTANALGLSSLVVGGGLNFYFGGGTVNLVSTIISGNENVNNAEKDLYADTPTIIATNSAITDTSGHTLDSASADNIFPTVAALNLGALNFYSGGTTKTHAPGPGSVAIDAGLNPGMFSIDQNGSPREQPTNGPDIGSVEVTPVGNPTALATFTTINSGSPYFNTATYQFTVKYTAASGDKINTTTLGPTDISFTGPGGYSKSAGLVGFTDPNGNQSLILATYSLPANTLGASVWDAADVGTYTGTLLADEVKATSGLPVQSATLGTFKVVLAATFTVTNAADAGPGSFRQALLDSNANSPTADTIIFDTAFFKTSLKTITLASALPSISDAVTITGPGATLAAVSGNNAVRVLDTSAAATASVIAISGLTLTGGSTAGSGGGLLIGDEKVSLTNVTVSASSAGTIGGGISVGGLGELTLTGSTVSGSKAVDGGGIACDVGTPSLTLVGSTVTGNTATQDGGGIYFVNGGDVNIQTSTLSNNVANGIGNGGGGLYFWGHGENFTIANTTITGNSAAGPGGGIVLLSTTGTFTLQNINLTNNTGTSGGGFTHASSTSTGTTAITFLNSTISGNVGTAGGGLAVNDNKHTTALNIFSSTISNNSGTTGGGLALNGNRYAGNLSINIRNSTVSSNSGSGGGGITLNDNTATAVFNILNSTVTANSASAGGGYRQNANAGLTTLNLTSSIVSGNTGGTSPDLLVPIATVLNVNFSAVGTTTGYTINGTNGNNLATADATPAALVLGTLSNNGGPTFTHALGTGSKAVNAGTNPAPALTSDQRGNPYIRAHGGGIDIGSFELQPTALAVTGLLVNGSASFTNVSRSRVYAIEVTFSTPVLASNFNALSAIRLTRIPSPIGVTGTVVETGVTSGAFGKIQVAQGTPQSLLLSFTNADGSSITPGVEFGSLSDGRWELVIASAGFNSTTAGINASHLRRLFGDSQNDGTVDGSDVTAFGNAFNTINADFDYNSDGTVDGSDLTQLGNRFGLAY